MKERERESSDQREQRENKTRHSRRKRLRLSLTQTCLTYVQGDTTVLQLEDDIRADLAKVGINVKLTALDRDALNTAMTSGNFNMAFSESWGPPYDPHR